MHRARQRKTTKRTLRLAARLKGISLDYTNGALSLYNEPLDFDVIERPAGCISQRDAAEAVFATGRFVYGDALRQDVNAHGYAGQGRTRDGARRSCQNGIVWADGEFAVF